MANGKTRPLSHPKGLFKIVFHVFIWHERVDVPACGHTGIIVGDAAVRRKSGAVGPLLLSCGSQRLKLRSPGTLTPRSTLAGTHT